MKRIAVIGAASGLALTVAGLSTAVWRVVPLVAGAAGLAVMLWRLRLHARTTAWELRTLRRERDELAAKSAERHTLQAVLLDSLQVGVAAFRGDQLVYANREAAAELGLGSAATDGPWPAAIRSAVAEAGAEPSRIQYESGHPARTREIVGTRAADSDLVVVRIVDVTGRVRTDRMRRDFVAAASHELKTPAAAIQAAAETVLVALDDDLEVARDFTQRVYQQATRLARIVADLLDLSRLEGGELDTADVDLREVVADEVARLGKIARHVEVDAAPVHVQGSVTDLALAVRNLLDNAVRYTARDGRIVVRVEPETGGVAVTVADDGVGIPSGDLPRIFERFYRVDEARSRATGGTGLGLAIVKHVAEQHGGSVSVESRIGEGSTFRLRIPLRR